MILNGVTASGETTSFEKEMSSYITNITPYHLAALNLSSNYAISEPIMFHDWDNYSDDKYIFIVMDNATNKMIGTIICTQVNGEFTSSFDMTTFTEIEGAISYNIPIQLGVSNSCFLMYDGENCTILENYGNVSESFVNDLIIDENNSDIIDFETEIIRPRMTRNTTYSTGTNPPLVSNSTCPETSKGLCWAACVASKGRLQRAISATITAQNIYDTCKNSNYSDRPAGNPIGTPAWTEYALMTCFSLSVAKNTALTNTEIITALNSNKPIICFVSTINDYDLNGDGEIDGISRHALLLWSMINLDNNNGTVYVYMDPGNTSNGPGMVIYHKSASNTTSSSISIASRNGRVYSIWYKSFY